MSAAVSTPGPSQDVRPIRRALVSVYDKTGLDELARGLHEAGVAHRLDRRRRPRLIESLGLPVTQVEELTGFPECLEGRVKTLHPRVHAGILADTRKPDHVAQLADLGVEAVRARRRQPLPVPRDRRLGREPGRVRRADRHRRPVDGARGRQEPPERRRRHRARRPTPTSLDAAARRRLHAASSASAWRREAFVHTASYDIARRVAGWATPTPTRRDGTGFPAWVGATWRARDGAALRREPAPAAPRSTATASGRGRPRPGDAAARQGDVVQQLRRRRCRRARRATTTATSRPWRSSSTPTRAASPSAPTIDEAHRRRPRVRPGVGLRRHHRDQPPGDRRRWPRDRRRHLHRGRRRARLRRRRPRGAHREEEPPRCCELPAGPARTGDRDAADQRRPARAAPRHGRRRRRGDESARSPAATTPPAGASCPASRPTTPPSPTSSSPGARCRAVKSNAILLARDGASVGVGMGQVNRVDSCHLAVVARG